MRPGEPESSTILVPVDLMAANLTSRPTTWTEGMRKSRAWQDLQIHRHPQEMSKATEKAVDPGKRHVTPILAPSLLSQEVGLPRPPSHVPTHSPLQSQLHSHHPESLNAPRLLIGVKGGPGGEAPA